MSQSSRSPKDADTAPVVPAVRDALQIAVAAHIDSKAGLLEVPHTIIGAILDASGRAEAAAFMLAFAVPDEARDIRVGPASATELLRLAGIRALETHDRLAFRAVIDRLARMSRNSTYLADCVGTASVLAAIAGRFDQRIAAGAVDDLLGMLDRAQLAGIDATSITLHRINALWRIGAAGLVAGALSVSLHAARKTCERGDQVVLSAMAADKDTLSRISGQSLVRGGFLGDSGMDALANFGRFVGALQPLLLPTPTGTP